MKFINFLVLLFLVVPCSSGDKKEDELKKNQSNAADNIECRWEKDSKTIAKKVGQESFKGSEKSACRGEKPPVSERVDSALKRDAKKIKRFFGFGE